VPRPPEAINGELTASISVNRSGLELEVAEFDIFYHTKFDMVVQSIQCLSWIN